MDGLDWINDVKSNQDIAQEIADKSKIKNNRLYLPSLSTPSRLSFFFSNISHLRAFPTPEPLFAEYCKEQYGLKKGDIKDVWDRYKKLIIGIRNLLRIK